MIVRAKELDTPKASEQKQLKQNEDDTSNNKQKGYRRKKKHWEIDYNELIIGKRIGNSWIYRGIVTNGLLAGKGAFGSVYAAEWRGTVVALKKIHSSDMSASDIETFKKEIQIIR